MQFQELISSLNQIRNTPNDVNTINQKLVELRSLKYEALMKLNSEELSKSFQEIWLFLLFASANSNSTIHISCIRTIGLFILQIYPFFPKQMKTAFSNVATVSTIELIQSPLLASAFAIITYHIADPYLLQYTTNTPIYHQLNSEDGNLMEQICQIVRHFDHLSTDWFLVLLQSYLEKLIIKPDRYTIRVVISIISLHPQELFLKSIKYVMETSKIDQLAFYSAILSEPNMPIHDTDLFDLAKIAVNSITQENNITISTCDSALYILSIKTESFIVKIDLKSDETAILTLLGDNHETFISKINILRFVDKPSFYELNLPLKLLKISESDGMTIISAKLKAMGKYLEHTNNVDEINYIIKVFCDSYEKEDPALSAAILHNLPYVVRNTHSPDTFHKLQQLLSSAIFVNYLGWFQAFDILTIINSFSQEIIGQLFPPVEIFDLVVSFAMHSNEKLAAEARKTLMFYAVQSNKPELLLFRILKNSNTLNPLMFSRTISIVSELLNEFPKIEIHQFISIAIESISYYANDQILPNILDFLSRFELESIDDETLAVPYSILCYTYQLITGIEWKFNSSFTDETKSLVDYAFSKQSLDIIDAPIKDISQIYKPATSSIKFITSLKSVSIKYVHHICDRLFNIYPREVTLLAYKNWSNFGSIKKLEFVTSNYNFLEYISDLEVHAYWFDMYLDIANNDTQPFLKDTIKFLKCINKSVLNQKKINLELRLKYILFYNKVHSQNSQIDISNYPPNINNIIKIREVPEMEERFIFSPVKMSKLNAKIDIVDPLVLTQLRNDLYQFNNEEIKELVNFYMEKRNKTGYITCFEYAKKHNISLPMSSYDFDSETFPKVLKYFSNDDLSKIKLATLSHIAKLDKIRSRDFKAYISTLNIFENDWEKMKDFFLEYLDKCSDRKLPYVMRLLTAALHEMKIINYDFSAQLLSKLSNRTDTGYEMCRLILELTKKTFDTARPKKFIKKLIPNSFMHTYAMLLHAQIISDSSFFDYFDLDIKLSRFLEVNLPSLFNATLRIIGEFGYYKKKMNSNELFNICYPKILNTRSIYNRNYSIHKEFAEMISYIISKESAFGIIDNIIINSFEKLMPPKNASILPYLDILPHLVIKETFYNQYKDKLNSFLKLMRAPSQFPVYIRIIEITCAYSPNKRIALEDSSKKWMSNYEKHLDYCSIQRIYRWEKMLEHYFTPIQVIEIMKTDFLYCSYLLASLRLLKDNDNISEQSIRVLGVIDKSHPIPERLEKLISTFI